MPDYTIRQDVKTPSGTISREKTYSAAGHTEISESIADSQTDKSVTGVAIDVSAVKSFYACSDRQITLETNDGGSPDDTLVLKAGVPYVWTTDSYDTFKLTADVTAIFVTNASGGAAALEIRVNQDPTP